MGARDRSPLREVFIEVNDALMYKITLNYLMACENVFWSHANDESFIFRTIGAQAIFDVLRKIAPDALEARRISVQYFTEILEKARQIDFSDERFRNPSGSGRTEIRRAIEEAIGIT